MDDDKGLIVAGSIFGALVGGVPGAIVGGFLGSVIHHLGEGTCENCKSQMTQININGDNYWHCNKCGTNKIKSGTKKESSLRR